MAGVATAEGKVHAAQLQVLQSGLADMTRPTTQSWPTPYGFCTGRDGATISPMRIAETTWSACSPAGGSLRFGIALTEVEIGPVELAFLANVLEKSSRVAHDGVAVCRCAQRRPSRPAHVPSASLEVGSSGYNPRDGPPDSLPAAARRHVFKVCTHRRSADRRRARHHRAARGGHAWAGLCRAGPPSSCCWPLHGPARAAGSHARRGQATRQRACGKAGLPGGTRPRSDHRAYPRHVPLLSSSRPLPRNSIFAAEEPAAAHTTVSRGEAGCSSAHRRPCSLQPASAALARSWVATSLEEGSLAYALPSLMGRTELHELVAAAGAARDAGIPEGTLSADETAFACMI